MDILHKHGEGELTYYLFSSQFIENKVIEALCECFAKELCL